jgi:hypothetical protein
MTLFRQIREYRSCAGIRIWIHRLSFVRAGVGNFQNVQQLDKKIGFQPNIGLGFKYKGIQIDYALTDLGNQSTAYSNIFSLKIDLSLLETDNNKTNDFNYFRTIKNGIYSTPIFKHVTWF